MTSVLIVGGSPRAGGNTQRLLEAAAQGVESAGATAEVIHLRDWKVQPCIGCERCRRDKACTGLHDAMQLIYPKLEAARGLILGSPVHNYNVTAWMKAFIDRLYCYYDFSDDRPRAYTSRLAGQGRKAAVVCVGEQPLVSELGVTQEALALPLEPLGYEVVGRLAVTGFFDRGAVRQDAGLMRRAHDLGRDLAAGLVE